MACRRCVRALTVVWLLLSTTATTERRGLSLPGGKRGANQRRHLSHFCHPIAGLAEHLGVIDCTPPTSELVRLGFNDALVSEPLNIHRSHPVVVGPVATVRALVFVCFLTPVRFAH